jgi:hypothetical protein
MTALQKFFDNAREVAKRRKEWEKKMIREMENPKIIEEVTNNYEEEFLEFDFLLRRGWFDEEYDIINLVWEASDEAFERIMKNVNAYPERVRLVLLYTFNPPKVSTKLKLKWREVSDLEMYRKQKEHQEKLNEKVEDAWKVYKKEFGLSRPDGDVDARYTELYEQLQEKKKDLEAKKNKPSKTYVPPSMRGKITNPDVEIVEKEIRNLENEIDRVKKLIELEEQIWENGKKSSVYEQLLQSVC